MYCQSCANNCPTESKDNSVCRFVVTVGVPDILESINY